MKGKRAKFVFTYAFVGGFCGDYLVSHLLNGYSYDRYGARLLLKVTSARSLTTFRLRGGEWCCWHVVYDRNAEKVPRQLTPRLG